MKNVILLIAGSALYFVSAKIGWYFEGQEAVASAKQLLTSTEDYKAARLEIEFWKTISQFISYAAVALISFASFFSAKDLIQKYKNKQ